jgi:hypothetical protein
MEYWNSGIMGERRSNNSDFLNSSSCFLPIFHHSNIPDLFLLFSKLLSP